MPLYKKKATRPAATAPRLMILAAAPPVNVAAGGLGLGMVLLVDLVELLTEPLVRVKLAHVRRVVLLVWILMERLPRKLPRPAWVET